MIVSTKAFIAIELKCKKKEHKNAKALVFGQFGQFWVFGQFGQFWVFGQFGQCYEKSSI